MNPTSAARSTADATRNEPILKYVQANGVRFAYLEQGSGPLVMFLHGFPDNAWSYRKQLQVFADAGYRAVSPFLRGYAPTEIPADGIFDPIALGKDLEALIAALSEDGQACVVGMDWGGTSTFQVLATAPSAIKAAVVMNTAHPITFSSIRRDPDIIRSIFHVYFFQMAYAESSVNIEGLPFVDYLWKLWSPTFDDPGHLRSIKQTLSSPGTMAAALKYYGGLTDAGRLGRLPINDMHTPTLTIYGSNDPTAKYSVKEEPLFKGPHQRIVLPDVGHFPHLEREAEVTALIMDWFKAHAPE
ncbi:alpha/beta fold hydrolase [Bradyrhizobium sp. GCM10027634]|uniref:alpha/beta fold hydrolase n=1 Tax=unclassified Bradyrhizobium TaxID=2631580 RepID=UPI00188AE151|nr:MULTISPECIES: alpha/beta hydrolase [unclassified Bradyrhizobium]MDN4999472.1 alpha/beta hydrolase [Bradyrhizobium sp. WYCCWR 12677]QOZ43594.1 alpha/beta hydrolase [Bradyrhizobium sp. CCBAU 53340]